MTKSKKFRQSLEDGYKKYLSTHPRSSEKIVPMHKAISEMILSELNKDCINDYTVKSMGIDDNREYKFSGRYYSKDIDITVFYKNKPISGLGFKFITSNYKQNSNNYFENMLGETANLKRADFLYGQVIVLKHKMPYYSSDKKTFTKIEHIDDLNLKKYVSLDSDNGVDLYHKPDIVYLSFIETGDEMEFEKIVDLHQNGNTKKINKVEFHKQQLCNVNVKFVDKKSLQNDFSTNTFEFLEKVGDFDRFIEAFVNLTKGKTYGR